MNTLQMLAVMASFFALPGIVIGGSMLMVWAWYPGFLTRHKHKVFAAACLLLALYGTMLICTESEGSMYTGQPMPETYLTDTQGERMFPCSGGGNCSGVLALHKGKYAGLGHKSPDSVVLCRKHLYRLAEHDEIWLLAGRMMSLMVKEGDLSEAEEMVKDLTLMLEKRKGRD